MVPLAALLLRTSDPALRGRVMGIRMFAIYALPIGLLAAGPLLKSIGYAGTALVYCTIGIGFTLLIAWRWRAHLWRSTALANAHGVSKAAVSLRCRKLLRRLGLEPSRFMRPEHEVSAMRVSSIVRGSGVELSPESLAVIEKNRRAYPSGKESLGKGRGTSTQSKSSAGAARTACAT